MERAADEIIPPQEQPRTGGLQGETEHTGPSSQSSAFKSYSTGDQVNAPSGKLNITKGPGNQFPGAKFEGPVYFGTNEAERVTNQHDDWKKQFGRKIKIEALSENLTFLDILRQHELDIDSEVSIFMRPASTSRRWERIALHIEGFCIGASFVLGRSVTGDAEKPTFEDVQEPRAWVSDRNCAPEGLPPPQRVYGRVLDCIELYAVLQKKRFRDDACDDAVGHSRRIYINNPNGASILALIRTAPASQLEGFRELFAHYITTDPAPNFELRESTWWGGCFVISFNIPFLAISTRDLQDVRTISNGGGRLRRRYDLSFLNSTGQGTGPNDDRDEAFLYEPFLHEAVCSLVVTGRSERYWTAVCLDDDFFDEERRLVAEEETLDLDLITDPIILKPEGDSTTESPRAYALASLAATLRGIAEHHAGIQEDFRTSLYRHTSNTRHNPPDYISPGEFQKWRKDFQVTLGRVMKGNSRLVHKVDEFLTQGVNISPDGLPHSPLWSGLQDEPGAIKSLQSIIKSRGSLRDTQNEFQQFIDSLNEFLQFIEEERKNYHVDEQQTRSRHYPGLFRVYVGIARLFWLVRRLRRRRNGAA